ncbi:hypothetical protein LI90_1502 [Carbonactinospora thermoautotrophica]|uniref:Uncharacterized protein n=1 Tax=Carbonactinospora thermoautotrophica TaxID=1469144 RepID=A0A132MPZ9_9ACTN|nr:hypothetical protein LI90_1502 [Carbonactinospora thermoautotrophica]
MLEPRVIKALGRRKTSRHRPVPSSSCVPHWFVVGLAGRGPYVRTLGTTLALAAVLAGYPIWEVFIQRAPMSHGARRSGYGGSGPEGRARWLSRERVVRRCSARTSRRTPGAPA